MFTAPAISESSDFLPLEDGCYEAVVVGLRGFVGTKYQSEEPEDKMQFVFQVQDGEGKLHYLTTKPLTNVLNDKSNLYKVLNGITGYGLDKFPVGFQYTQFVNAANPVKCQLTVKTVASKKDPTKQFNEIDSYLKAKKNQKTTFVPDDKAPAWLNMNLKEACWIHGLAFQAPKDNVQPRAATIPAAVATSMGDSSAFFGQGQVSQGFATPNSEVPVAPFNPNDVGGPASAPSPYVAPQRKDGTFVPAPAPAPQPPMFGQAVTGAGNTYPTQAAPQVDSEDLPF